jgi:tetratricopeptide (TPR) repeat protein
MRSRFYLFTLIFCLVFGINAGFAQKGNSTSQTAARTITIITEPNAIVWLNGINYGTTDESGKLTIKPVAAGAHSLRVRADGFKEVTQNLTAAQKGDVTIALTKTTDEAELAFQQAEREKSVGLYEKAIKLRPKYAEAYLGLSRVLADQESLEEAHEAIAGARKARPGYPEASAVEGRIYKTEGNEEKAIASFKRAIREGKGFQPEAHTGLALLYKEKAEFAGGSGDFETEKANYEESVKWFAPAVKQLASAPDAIIVYQLYGLVYEKMKKYKEAIKIYEDFLKVFPDTSEAGAVSSFIIQLKKQLSETQP